MNRKTLIPAAEYVRMSTDEQLTSIPVQKTATRAYAAAHGFKIIATYSDLGKSGVAIRQRPGLRKMLADVANGDVLFKAILVYDVSRWGRFQDVDEAAHYEFICRSAGVAVHYCAEQFLNDGTAPNAVIKALKRSMAAEYSRELSVKVVAGQRLIAADGFRLGGVPGYGLRRMLVSSDGRRKRLLKDSEHKSTSTDRVILVPGPSKEVDCIRNIFDWCQRWSPARIAEELNRNGVKFTGGKKWTEATIYRILRNEKYMGVHIWGKTKQHFKTYGRRAPDEWIRRADAFTPLIRRVQFEKANTALHNRKTWPGKPDEFLLDRMKTVLGIEGRLSETLLSKHHVFTPYQYLKRLGTIKRAYDLIGYDPPDRAFKSLPARRKIKRLRTEVLTQLTKLFPSLRLVRLPGQQQREVLELDPYSYVALHVCIPRKPTVSGAMRWMLSYQPKERGLPCLICIPEKALARIRSYYVVAPFDPIIVRRKIIWESHPWLASGFRLSSLSEFYKSAKKILAKPPRETTIAGDVVFTSRTPTITIAGTEFFLPSIAATMFKLLVKKAGHFVSRMELAEAGISMLGPGASKPYDPTGQFVKSHIQTLRKRLGDHSGRIIVLRGRGYVYVMENASRSTGLPTRL